MFGKPNQTLTTLLITLFWGRKHAKVAPIALESTCSVIM